MRTKSILVITALSTLIFTGCQNNDLSAENQSLKQQITELQQQITQLQNDSAAPNTENTQSATGDVNNVSSNTAAPNPSEIAATIYSLEELSAMVDEFVAKVGSVTPDVNNSGNLDQFFSLKREGDQVEHALENYENDLENQYRTGTITREDYRKLEWEIEQLEEVLDSASDRLEITFGIDD